MVDASFQITPVTVSTVNHPVKRFPTFEKRVWKNPCICNNCFRRFKERYKIWKDAYPLTVQQMLRDERHFLTKDGAYYIDGETKPDRGVDRKVSRPATIHFGRPSCKGCGSVGGYKFKHTLSKEEALDMTKRLEDRLAEQDITVDSEKLRETVRRGKRRASLQGYDREIFGLAVELAKR